MAERKERSENDEEETMKPRWESAKEKLSQARNKTQHFVEEHPWKSAGIAAAVGAITALGVAAIVGRRRGTFWDRLRDLF